jgi:hypothetical protein
VSRVEKTESSLPRRPVDPRLRVLSLVEEDGEPYTGLLMVELG